MIQSKKKIKYNLLIIVFSPRQELLMVYNNSTYLGTIRERVFPKSKRMKSKSGDRSTSF